MFTEKDVRVKKRVEQTSVILLKDKLWNMKISLQNIFTRRDKVQCQDGCTYNEKKNMITAEEHSHGCQRKSPPNSNAGYYAA
jgi:hypothetical protein